MILNLIQIVSFRHPQADIMTVGGNVSADSGIMSCNPPRRGAPQRSDAWLVNARAVPQAGAASLRRGQKNTLTILQWCL
jgi:hypothetical protein